MSMSVKVATLPMCDLCKHYDGKVDVPARYDGKTQMGPWANMCLGHFMSFGSGLGMGHGQELILITDEDSARSDEDIADEIRACLEDGDWEGAEDAVGDRDIAEFM